MSAADSNEFLNDINETDFPYLTSKPCGKRAERGRRSGAEQLNARRVAQSTIMKTIHDPQQVLGKRRKARLLSGCADNMAVGVQYSLNRKNRWEQTEASDLLQNTDGSEIEVAVIDKVLTKDDGWYGYASTDKVAAIHSLGEDGNIVTKCAKGRGAPVKSLECSGKKKAAKTSDSCDEEEEEAEPKARLEYRVMKTHKNNRVLVGKLSGRGGRCNNRGRRNKNVDLTDLETSEMENSVHLDENTIYKPSRDFRFSLGDYITTNSPAIVHVRRQSIESVKNMEEIEKEVLSEGPRPFDLLDISAAARAPCIHERVFIKTTKWNDFNFNQQVEQLFSDSSLVVRWLDVNHQRASVDLTPKLQSHNPEKTPELMIVLEKGNKSRFSLTLSTTVPSNGPMSWRTLKSLLMRPGVNSISNALEMLLNLVKEWRNRQLKQLLATATRSPKYDAAVNSHSMAKKANILSEREMASILREDGRSLEEEPFERIADDEFSSGDDSLEFETNFGTPTKIKCASCLASSLEELFELDDCWKCRECLRHQIVQQIRTKNIPLDIPFMMDVSASTYDVLPALLPLPLVQLYTKIAAKDLLQLNCNEEVADLLECPCCQETVQVQRPNEYSSCLCSGCAAVWCSDCKLEPHWPMNCQQKKEWSEKWNKQYPEDVIGNVDSAVQVDSAARFIKKDFAEPCFAARSARFNQKKTSEIEKKCRKAKDVVANAGKVSDLRRSILCLVEFGLGWLYLSKGGPQGLKSSLLQLVRQYEDLVDEISLPKVTTADRIVALEKEVEKIVDQFKKAV